MHHDSHPWLGWEPTPVNETHPFPEIPAGKVAMKQVNLHKGLMDESGCITMSAFLCSPSPNSNPVGSSGYPTPCRGLSLRKGLRRVGGTVGKALHQQGRTTVARASVDQD